MEEPIWRREVDRVTATGLAHGTNDALELGSLVAALCEETEDDFELDLQVRAFVESGGFRFIPESIPEDMLREN